MKHITQKDLEGLVQRINKATRSPAKPYETTPDGQLYVNIGNYHLDGARGGVRLLRIYNKNGDFEIINLDGDRTKRQLYNWMDGFLAGLERCNLPGGKGFDNLNRKDNGKKKS